MLTTKYVREHAEEIRKTIKDRGSKFPLDELLGLDEKWRKMKTELQGLQAERNKASLEISEMKKKGVDVQAKIKALGDLKAKLEGMERDLPALEEKIDALLWNVPNILDKSVPVGNPPEANKELRKWGTIKERNIGTHEEILSKLNMLDMDRAAKVTGARFYYLKGDIVLLEHALTRFTLDLLGKRGFVPVLPPFMLRKKYYRGVAPLATFEDALYKVGETAEASKIGEIEHIEDELFMIGTAEHVLAAMHADELFSGKELPLKYAGWSPCFRREAGAHGKDQKGIFRVHQFEKIEQFVYCKEEDEEKYFNEMLDNTEQIWQQLNVPYRLLLLCTGDTGHQMTKTVDIECYFPGQKAYRELGSCSSAGTWQSMRLDIKYDDKGERKYVYTLNNTAVPMQRALACIVENYVNPDGTITVPDALVPYMGKSKIG